MPDPIPDLWPSQIDVEDSLRAPAAILSEQASLLGAKTQNIVQAEVKPLKLKERSRVGFSFNLVAPALNSYRLRLFQISHEMTQLYPVRIINTLKIGDDGRYVKIEAHNEDQFISQLRAIFSSEETISAIQSLRVQSEGFPFESDDDILF